jgi:hypothetical protein
VDSISVALRAVAVQNWLSIAAALSGIAVPILGVVALLRWAARRPWWRATALWISGCSGLLVYAAVAFVFAVCWGGEIGESGMNRLARAYGAAVVAGLDRYRAEKGSYPTQLRDLVPQYISSAELSAPTNSVLEYPFEYRADSGSFELVVRYVGPGMNECRIRPGAKWHCGGYF